MMGSSYPWGPRALPPARCCPEEHDLRGLQRAFLHRTIQDTLGIDLSHTWNFFRGTGTTFRTPSHEP